MFIFAGLYLQKDKPGRCIFKHYLMNIEDIEAICKALPGVTTDVKWGQDLVFSVGAKMFCVVGLEQSPVTASFKVTDEEFDEMSSRPGFKPAPSWPNTNGFGSTTLPK